MFVIGHNQLRKFRRLGYFSPTITILFLSLLVWMYRSNMTFQFFSQDYQVEPTPPGPTETLFTRAAPQELNVSVVAVEGTKTLLLGAFLEHRTYKKKVRVNAVVLRKERVAYRCLLRCQGQLHTSGSFCSIHTDHFGFPYGTADILCHLPSGCQSPSHVAVTPAAAKSKGAPDEDFLEVKNQKKRSDSFPYNFTVCFSTMYNFTNVLQLVQSLEMLQLLGVNRVVIYKTSTSPETQRILDYYTQKGGVWWRTVLSVSTARAAAGLFYPWFSSPSPPLTFRAVFGVFCFLFYFVESLLVCHVWFYFLSSIGFVSPSLTRSLRSTHMTSASL